MHAYPFKSKRLERGLGEGEWIRLEVWKEAKGEGEVI